MSRFLRETNCPRFPIQRHIIGAILIYHTAPCYTPLHTHTHARKHSATDTHALLTPPNYYCNIARPAGEERRGEERRGGERRERERERERWKQEGEQISSCFTYCMYKWCRLSLVLILREDPAHMLPMHNAKRSSGV